MNESELKALLEYIEKEQQEILKLLEDIIEKLNDTQ